MSLSSLNQFPVLELSQVKVNTFQLAVLGAVLIQFLLLHIFHDRKRISSFFSGFQATCDPANSAKNRHSELSEKEGSSVDQSVCRRDQVEIVLRSLGISGNSTDEEANLPARFNADDIFNIFEERNPSFDELREAFDVFDENRDGFIDAKELQRVLCVLGFKEGSEMEKCGRMIGVFDENDDGRIDFQEFVKFMEDSFN